MDSGDPASDNGHWAGGHLLSWGCGEFGQHGHGGNEDVGPDQAHFILDQVQDQASESPHPDLETRVQERMSLDAIKYVACGASHTAVVTEDGEIWTWGNGSSGQLGCGDKLTHSSPQHVQIGPHDSQVAGIECGSRHTVIWLKNGRAYSYGNNFYAQLGYDFRIKNYKENQVLPHLLRPIIHLKVIQVACGEKFSLFLFDSGLVGGCGANNFGQLGNGTRAEAVSPKPLEEPDDIVTIACGSCHSLAVTASGELYVWGLGRACGSRRDDILIPQRKKTRHKNVIRVASGSAHSLALTANGTVYSWGGGTDGQLGHGEDVLYVHQPRPLSKDALPGRVVQVACGDSYSAALLGDGSLYMWGKNSHVISCQDTSSTKVYHPTLVGFSDNQPVAVVSCGSWHAAAITGTPLRQALEEDSEVSDLASEEELDVFDPMEAEGDPQDLEGQGNQSTGVLLDSNEVALQIESKAAKKYSFRPVDRSKPPMRLAREGTKLTLEEFYSATPLPSARSEDDSIAEQLERKKTPAKEENVDNFVTGSGDCFPASEADMHDDSFEGNDQVQHPSEAEQSDNISSLKKDTSKKTAKVPPKIPYLPRSRTVDSIQKKVSSNRGVPNVYDMTAMSSGGDADQGGINRKFVIDKHVAIQSTRKASSTSSASVRKSVAMSGNAARNYVTPSGSTSKNEMSSSDNILKKDSSPSSFSSSASSRRVQESSKAVVTGKGSPKHSVATVSLMSSSKELANINDVKPTNIMPIPKMTRAHTLYGQMGSKRKTEMGKGIAFSPPVVHAVAPASSDVNKTIPSKILQKKVPDSNSLIRPKGPVKTSSRTGMGSSGPKSREFSEMTPLHNRTAVGTARGQSNNSSRISGSGVAAQRKPVFSSAGSWRKRDTDNVLGAIKPTKPSLEKPITD